MLRKFEPGELQKEFFAALRSGKYKQGTGRMKYIENSDTLYCPLGVACEIAGEKKISHECL